MLWLYNPRMELNLAERALVFADPSGVVRNWNTGAEALFGHGAADAIGQTLDLVVPPDYRERHWAGYRAAMAASDGNIDHGSFNVPALHRDGTVMRIAVRLLVVHDSRNRVIGALAVFSPDDDSAPPLTRL
jgi:PAS domain S-box-containing protein